MVETGRGVSSSTSEPPTVGVLPSTFLTWDFRIRCAAAPTAALRCVIRATSERMLGADGGDSKGGRASACVGICSKPKATKARSRTGRGILSELPLTIALDLFPAKMAIWPFFTQSSCLLEGWRPPGAFSTPLAVPGGGQNEGGGTRGTEENSRDEIVHILTPCHVAKRHFVGALLAKRACMNDPKRTKGLWRGTNGRNRKTGRASPRDRARITSD
jgi:hypothetical protein